MNSDLFRFSIDGNLNITLQVSPWLLIGALALVGLFVLLRRMLHGWEVCKVNVDLGGVGQVELRPNLDDVQIAHRIWVELVTRKAALPIDPERDLILEVYDSWYALFGRIRLLLGEIPGRMIRRNDSTRKLIRIATDTLNKGLRPHLTEWHARYRSWYGQHTDELKVKTPQMLQRDFPEYEQLISDIQTVNRQLIQYAAQLQKIIHGRA